MGAQFWEYDGKGMSTQHDRLLACAGYWLVGLWHEFRAARTLFLKRRLFAALGTLTVALGIAALGTVFSIFDSALLRPLPYEGKDPLLAVVDSEQLADMQPYALSFQYYARLRESNRCFGDLGLYANRRVELQSGESRERLDISLVTATIFTVLKTVPIQGRVFSVEEDHPGGREFAIISASFWREHLGGREGALGQQINLDGIPHTIIGILPASFSFPNKGAQVWVPLQVDLGTMLSNPQARYPILVATLKGGIALDTAEQDLRAALTKLDSYYRKWPPTQYLPRLMYYRGFLISQYRKVFILLLLAGICVMAIACANLTNLFLIRSEKMCLDDTLRVALGASMWRLLARYLLEGLLITATGGLLGALLARWCLDLIKMIALESIPRLTEAAVHSEAVALILATCTLTVIIIAAAQSRRAGRINLTSYLNASTKVSQQGGRKVRRYLVSIEFALALLLMVEAGLMIRSMQNIVNVGLGFNPDNVVTFAPQQVMSIYPTAGRWLAFCDTLEEHLKALPGVISVGRGNRLPLAEGFVPESTIRADIDGKATPALSYTVSPGYFKAMGIPILKGRNFDQADRGHGYEQAVIIDANLAAGLGRTEKVLGSRLFVSPPAIGSPGEMYGKNEARQSIILTIIGIVPSLKKYSFRNLCVLPARLRRARIPPFFRPVTQLPRAACLRQAGAVGALSGGRRYVAEIASRRESGISRPGW